MTLLMEIYKCSECSNVIEVVKQGDGELVCCGKKMEKMEQKIQDQGYEKHLPSIKETDDLYVIQIGETEHPMTEEHHIEWIEVITDEGIMKKNLKPGENPLFSIDKKRKIKIARAFCNIHGLWKKANTLEYTKEDMILFALKSETGAKTIYSDLSKRVKNLFLKERFEFLANEEEKHMAYFEELYKKTFSGKSIVLPPDDAMPLPKINVGSEKTDISEIISSAMEAELASQEFYMEMSKAFADSPSVSRMLKFFASMEMIHYSILSVEKKNAEIFESYETEVPMIHVGP